MKKLMKAVLFGAVMLGAVMLGAVSLMGAEFRIDLQVQKNTCGLTADGGSEGIRMEKAKWLKEKADCRLHITGKSGEKWEEKWVRFIPAEDCSVSIQLMSPSTKDYVAFDNIRIEGASLTNGSFEKINKNNHPHGWFWMGKKYVVKKPDAADGEIFVEVSHNDRAIQNIKCKKGQPVKITFMVRDAKR